MRKIDKEGMGKIINSYCSALFKSSRYRDLETIFEGWTKVISEAQRRDLVKVFHKSKVEAALNQMAPSKAPGPEGLPPSFF